MTWFKVDDSLAFHHKAVRAGNAAMGLWVRAGSWSAQQLQDGFVPGDIAAVLGSSAQAKRLVRAGLWVEVAGGFAFHEWGEEGRQPSRKEVLERRAREAERKAKYRAAKSVKPQVNDDRPHGTDASVPPGVPGGVLSSRPDPTRPDLLLPTGVDTSPAGEDPDFAKFWSAYPRRAAKDAARKAWAKAVRRAPAADIIVGAERYRDDPNRSAQFTKHPATWLNGGCWSDEPAPPRLRAVGEYQPYRNPDPDEYERGFFDER